MTRARMRKIFTCICDSGPAGGGTDAPRRRALAFSCFSCCSRRAALAEVERNDAAPDKRETTVHHTQVREVEAEKVNSSNTTQPPPACVFNVNWELCMSLLDICTISSVTLCRPALMEALLLLFTERTLSVGQAGAGRHTSSSRSPEKRHMICLVLERQSICDASNQGLLRYLRCV